MDKQTDTMRWDQDGEMSLILYELEKVPPTGDNESPNQYKKCK